jgi:hypothetical protein
VNFEYQIMTRGIVFYDGGIRRIIEKYTKEDDKVVIISTNVSDSFPLMTAMQRRPGSRFLTCFWIAMLYTDRSPRPDAPVYRAGPEMIPEEKRLISELKEDIDSNKPRLVLIRGLTGAVGLNKDFSIYDYLTAGGFVRFMGAEYSELGTTDGFRIFIRKPKLGPRYRPPADHREALTANR